MTKPPVCMLPAFRPTDIGGVAAHVRNITKVLEQRGWSVSAQHSKKALVHVHAVDRAPSIDVYTNHGIYPITDSMPQWQREANSAIFENLHAAREVVAVSAWTAAQWSKLTGLATEHWIPIDRNGGQVVFAGRLTIIPNGVNLAEWRDVPRGKWRSALRIPDDRPVALWGKTGLSDVLDPTPAIELAICRPDVTVISMLPVGALTTVPDNFLCVGVQTPEHTKFLIADCDVYLATVQENHSVQVLEALALGKRVLGYDWGGTAETLRAVDGEVRGGVLVAPRQHTELAEQFDRVYAEGHELQEESRAVAAQFELANLVGRLEDVYMRAWASRESERSRGAITCSIVVPVYNKANFVAETLASARAQVDAPNYEIVVVDDGSTDASLQVCREIAKSDSRIRVFARSNQGVAQARNFGITQTRGRLITCLDADDRIDPLFLARLSATLESDPRVDIAYSDMITFGVNPETGPWSQYLLTSEYDFTKLRRGNFIPCCNLFRKQAWLEAGGYKDINPSWEDYELWLNIGKLGRLGRRVPSGLFYYRKVQQSGRDFESHGHEWRLRGIVNSYHRDLYQPAISVVIPCYKQAEFLPDALRSVLAQTFPDFEVVVVDDGNSEVQQRAIKEAVVAAGPAVRLVRLQENSGLASARNFGISMALGSWIVPLDADDKLAPEFLEVALRATNLDVHRFAYPDSYLWWPETSDSPERLQELPAKDYDFTDMLRRATWPCTIMYAKKAWQDAGGYKPQMSELGGWEDWEFAITLGENGVCGVRMPKYLFYYRQHSEDQMRHRAQANKPQLLEALRRLHAAVYRGERPMGCCGSGRTTRPNAEAVAAQPTARSQQVAVTAPQVVVRYTGNCMGSTRWVGPASGRAYHFSAVEPLQEVNAEDASFFDNRRDFKIVGG